MKKALVNFGFNALEMALSMVFVVAVGASVASVTESKPATFASLVASTALAVVVSEKAVNRLRGKQ